LYSSITVRRKCQTALLSSCSSTAVRRRNPALEGKSPQTQPAALVHVDQTTQAAINRVHRHLTAADVPELLEKRFQIINLWRPISHAAYDWPLALCDYTSVEPKDLLPVALIASIFRVPSGARRVSSGFFSAPMTRERYSGSNITLIIVGSMLGA
jgi:hypothetical protein